MGHETGEAGLALAEVSGARGSQHAALGPAAAAGALGILFDIQILGRGPAACASIAPQVILMLRTCESHRGRLSIQAGGAFWKDILWPEVPALFPHSPGKYIPVTTQSER